MTFVVGLTCSDGIVMCCDSLEDDGITKKVVDKIYNMGNLDWQIAVSGSGPAAVLDKFAVALAHIPRNRPFSRSIEQEIEDVLIDFNDKYVRTSSDRFFVVIGVYDRPSGFRRLYKGSCVENATAVLTPVFGECHTGMGNELWRMLADTLYNAGNSVADNVRLATFATRLAIKYASGVDDPIQLLSYTFGEVSWKRYTKHEIASIEAEVSLDEFDAAIRRFWRMHNPPNLNAQLAAFRGVRTPGDELTLLDGVKVEDIYTASGRQRVVKTFRRNTDKLRQRANLLKARSPAVPSST